MTLKVMITCLFHSPTVSIKGHVERYGPLDLVYDPVRSQ